MNDNFIKKQLINIIEKSDFTELHLSVESENEIILKKIQNILKSYDNNDFMCIEEIVDILESYGFDCGNCHDFG